jgi:opacity protein-like surface antigen
MRTARADFPSASAAQVARLERHAPRGIIVHLPSASLETMIMKLFAGTLALACLFASCAAAPSRAPQAMTTAERDNKISLYLGQRHLDEDDYEPVDGQGTIGFEYVREPAGSPLGFEVGLMASGDDDDIAGLDIEGRTGEIYGGLRKTFGSDVVRPYVGLGVAVINSEVEVEGVAKDDDSSFAGYVHGGLTVDVSSSFAIGLDLRFLFGSDMTIAGVDTDADYGQLALVFAFAF